MSTNNIQNYLSNVFRPVTVYDPTATPPFQVKLNMSNINTIVADSVTVGNIEFGDQAGNVYLGLNAGNPSENPRGSTNNVAVGLLAGSDNSNVANSVFIGYAAGTQLSNASNVIAVGANTVVGGSNTIYIGTNTGDDTGSNNVYIGNNIETVNSNNKLLVGNNSNNILIGGDFSTKRIGFLTANPAYPITMSGYTYVTGGVGIVGSNGGYTLNVSGNFQASDAYGLINFGYENATSNTIVNLQSKTISKKAILNVSGDINAKGILNVCGESTFTSNVDVIGNLNVCGTIFGGITPSSNGEFAGYLNVSGDANFYSNVGVLGDLNISGNIIGGNISTSNGIFPGYLNVSGDANFYSNVGVLGDLNISGNIIGGNISTSNGTFPGYLNVSGDANFYSNVGVLGNLNVSGTTDFYSNTGILGDLNVSGIAKLASNVDIIGNLNVCGAIIGNVAASSNGIFPGYLNVSGLASLYSNVSITGDLSVAGIIYGTTLPSPNLTLTGTLDVQDVTRLSNTVTLCNNAQLRIPGTGGMNVSGVSVFSNVSVNGLLTASRYSLLATANTLNVSGASSLYSTLNVVGATTLSNTLNVVGATTLSNTLNVIGATTLSNTLTLSNNAQLRIPGTGGMNVSGVAVFSNVTVNGTLTTASYTPASLATSGTLSVSGASTLSNGLTVTGATTTLSNGLTTPAASSAVFNGPVTFNGVMGGPGTRARYQFFNTQLDRANDTPATYWPTFNTLVQIYNGAADVNLTFTLAPGAGETDIRVFNRIVLYVYGPQVDGLNVVVGTRPDNINDVSKRTNLINLGNPISNTFGGYTSTIGWNSLVGSYPPTNYIVVGALNGTVGNAPLVFLLQSNLDYTAATNNLVFSIADGRNGNGGSFRLYRNSPVIFQAFPLFS